MKRRRLAQKSRVTPTLLTPEGCDIRVVPTLLTPAGCDYVCVLKGPILLTAPHSLKLRRRDGSQRFHNNERFTAEFVTKVSQVFARVGVQPSMMMWNACAGPGSNRLDPNYLHFGEQFDASPWHRALHCWLSKNPELPLFHVDVHGKVNNKTHLDVGLAPMHSCWQKSVSGELPAFARDLAACLVKGFDHAMASCGVLNVDGEIMTTDPNPKLHGFWGDRTFKTKNPDPATMSHQSILLGIPAVQLEMPPALRRRLADDSELLRLFAETIYRAYSEVVLPWWPRLNRPTMLQLRTDFSERLHEEKVPASPGEFDVWCDKLSQELREADVAALAHSSGAF